MEKIRAHITAFEACCKKHIRFGARDSEPDVVFQVLLSRASRGRQPEIPRTPSGWELLYQDDPDCLRAAGEMHYAAWQVIEEIETCPVRNITTLSDLVRDYCWRLK